MKCLNPRILLVSAAVAVLALTTTTVGAATATPARTAAVSMAKKRTVEPVTFTLSSFNVLGSTHTTSGSRMASGVDRIALAVKLLDRTETDVVGFQELQLDQFYAFYNLAGDRYGIYPGGVDRRSVQNSIAWKLDTWRMVEDATHTVSIPYFDGIEWQMPVVLLQNVQSGQVAWFANFHNPATNKKHPGQDKWRAEAMRREIALAKTLYWETGYPVFITGDMNEREKYFCPMVAGAPMKAANGGSYNRKTRACTPPKPMPVDWIFGPKRRATFSNYVRDDSALVRRITDHFVIRADVTLPAPPLFLPPPPVDPTTPTP